MVSKELTKHLEDHIDERYRSGEGYERISETLYESWNSGKAIINKFISLFEQFQTNNTITQKYG